MSPNWAYAVVDLGSSTNLLFMNQMWKCYYYYVINKMDMKLLFLIKNFLL